MVLLFRAPWSSAGAFSPQGAAAEVCAVWPLGVPTMSVVRFAKPVDGTRYGNFFSGVLSAGLGKLVLRFAGIGRNGSKGPSWANSRAVVLTIGCPTC